MKVYPHLWAKLFNSPLLVRQSVAHQLQRELLARMGGNAVAIANVGDDHPLAAEPRSESAKRRMVKIMETFGDVAVIQVQGIIDKSITDFEMDCYGGYDINDLNNALSYIEGREDLTKVVINFNTPGGSATGVPETGARLAAMRQKKEMHAYIDALCCSAGYWLASQCDVIASAPSAVTGSIGVYMALLDQTKALEMEGLKVNLIKSGRLKAMGASFKELTDEERGILQREVSMLHDEFKAAVTSLRKISDEAMQGQHFTGKDAKDLGLVDELTNASLDEYVSALIGR